ncbi:hypothetical protein QJS83_14590 [Bdellovibrio sp. 22V]|uniref:hypothetical protein n=1 Tax=Bdellovibrio sp. 22V TaxID=3044166 RepID=UPI00254288A8|nr:hypothetical protein [Bdellovibrio sp. 22V]WII71694.1 hypothetical protein QJS83_14590 [Bdellovibrio sp. 22V]
MRFSLNCILTLLSFLLLANHAQAGMFTWVRWLNPAVKVCFANPVPDSKEKYKRAPWTEEKKLQVQRWIEEEYSASRTGVHFVGFQDCVRGDRSKVIINYRKKLSLGLGGITWASATVGEQLSFVSKDFPGAVSEVHFFVGGFDKATVVHEFGHVAGLYHEHDHPQAQGCSVRTEDNKELVYVRGYTEYDRESVMSYCVTREFKDRGLSAGDILTLRLMYIINVSPPPEPTILR